MVTVVSRCVGAGDYEKARYYAKKLLKSTYIYMTGIILLSFAALPWILKLYNVSEEATEYARQIIWLHGLLRHCDLAAGLHASSGSPGRWGHPLHHDWTDRSSMWTLRVGLGILLGRYLGFGVLGIWISMFFDWILRAALFIPRFLGHRWETMGLSE